MSLTDLEVEQELDRIYDLEDLIMDGRYETLDKIIELVDVENISPVFLLAYVTVSRLAAEHLPSRVALVKRFAELYPEYKGIAW